MGGQLRKLSGQQGIKPALLTKRLWWTVLTRHELFLDHVILIEKIVMMAYNVCVIIGMRLTLIQSSSAATRYMTSIRTVLMPLGTLV
jgi:hypothetical protein